MTVLETQVKTAVSGTGAPSHPGEVWLQTLEAIEKEVRRLQVRIAKAALDISVVRPGLVEAVERLEPYEGVLSRTVLRGGWCGNTLSLPD